MLIGREYFPLSFCDLENGGGVLQKDKAEAHPRVRGAIEPQSPWSNTPRATETQKATATLSSSKTKIRDSCSIGGGICIRLPSLEMPAASLGSHGLLSLQTSWLNVWGRPMIIFKDAVC